MLDEAEVRAQRRLILATVILLLLSAGSWIWFFAQSTRGPQTNGGTIVLVVFVGLYVLLVVSDLASKNRSGTRIGLMRTAFYFLGAFLLLTSLFANSYWNLGTTRDFNYPLSHLDAVYFMFGTLTTAGTGNLNTISERARRVQLAQLVSDFMLLVVALALLVYRLGEHRSRERER